MTKRASRSDAFRAPDSFEAFKESLAGHYVSLSGQLQRIAHYVVDHPDDVALDTVTTTANRIGVQPSSVVRFAQALGYTGFTDMQRVFRAHLIAGTTNYRSRLQSLRASGVMTESQGVLGTFVDQGISALQRLRDQTSADSLVTAIDLMAQASEVLLIGQRRSFPVSFYLAYALARLERRCRLVDGAGGMSRPQIALAGRNDVAIVTSFAPYAAEVQDAVGFLRSRNVPMIAITDSALSPIAQQAQVAFAVQDSDDRAFRSLVAPLCLAQSLVVGLGLRLEQDNKDHVKDPQP